MILTATQVAQAARTAGFDQRGAIIAVAIAKAESGFNSTAIGDVNLSEPGERSVGLWQINFRPSRDQAVPYRDPILNLDPAHNAAAAFIISGRGVSFSPWSTFTSNAYVRHMPEAAAAVNALFQPPKGPDMAQSNIVAFEATPTGKGYWIVFSDGAVFGFGDAEYHGRVQLDANSVWRPVQP